jgi:pyruvate-formate lyase-activating enzyme
LNRPGICGRQCRINLHALLLPVIPICHCHAEAKQAESNRVEYLLPDTAEIPSGSEANEWYNCPQIKWFTRKSNALESPGDALQAGVPKARAVAYLDQLQQATFSDLMDEYDDTTFAQLLALKLANLAATQYHLANRHSVLFSHPVLLRVDPANACQLACPGCIHSENNVRAGVFDWPSRTLSVDTHEAWLTRLGPFAFCAALYNYGEPLLNKRFAEIVRRSKEYLLYTITSTNLSLPLNNEDAIVASGLDRMVLSIDGTSQETYGRYRRKGDLDLVFKNVRVLAAAKKRAGSLTPYLVWQFLTFEHNQHQTQDAIRLGQELGVNELRVTTPFSVELDDPTIHAVTSPDEGTYVFDGWDSKWCSSAIRSGARKHADVINEAFSQSWTARFESLSAFEERAAPLSPTCWWLYYNLTLDGAGRILPCCMAPDKSEKKLVFTKLTSNESRGALDLVNTDMATMARQAFADRVGYHDRASRVPADVRPYCATCAEKPSSPYNQVNIRNDIRAMDEAGVVSDDLIAQLTAWE